MGPQLQMHSLKQEGPIFTKLALRLRGAQTFSEEFNCTIAPLLYFLAEFHLWDMPSTLLRALIG